MGWDIQVKKCFTSQKISVCVDFSWNDCVLPYKDKCDHILKVILLTLKVQSHLSLLCIISYCHSNMNLHDLEFCKRVKKFTMLISCVQVSFACHASVTSSL